MPHFVQQHDDEIDIGAMVAVQAEIERRAGQATRLAQVDVEVGIDLGEGRVQRFGAIQFVSQGIRIPGAGFRRAGKVAEHGGCACAAEYGAGGVASQTPRIAHR